MPLRNEHPPAKLINRMAPTTIASKKSIRNHLSQLVFTGCSPLILARMLDNFPRLAMYQG
jgi:hypothetical protein